MNNELLIKYAKLIARKGINVEKGEEVWVNAELDQPAFIRLVVEELYKAGAGKVKVNWSDTKTARSHYKYQTAARLGKIDSYDIAKYKYLAKKLPSMLHIISEDPDALKGVNQKKITKARMKSYPKIKPYRDQMDGKYKWCIAAVPNIEWARKVFPGLSDAEAEEKLWAAILSTSRVDENDPCDNWDKHNADIFERRKALESLNLVELEYKSSNGTDFKVGLIPGMLWCGGSENCVGKSIYNPNIPSEEVFTSPMSGKAEGKLVASKPLSYQGELIEDFAITFKDGRAVAVEARKGQKLLEDMIKMDEGAAKLGEVALIPYDSPIRNTDILFYNTLFDENAACHFALGAGFPECYPGGLEMNHDDLTKAGVNDSMIHVDFMIGTEDLSIVGIDANGKRTQIFKDGNWAF